MGIVENKEVNAALAETIKPELLPTKERIMDRISYTAAFLGGCVSVGTFSMGASLIGVLGVARIEWGKWAKFQIKMQAFFFLMGTLIIGIAVAIHLQ